MLRGSQLWDFSAQNHENSSHLRNSTNHPNQYGTGSTKKIHPLFGRMRSYCGKENMRNEIMVIKYMKRKSWKISMPRTSQTAKHAKQRGGNKSMKWNTCEKQKPMAGPWRKVNANEACCPWWIQGTCGRHQKTNPPWPESFPLECLLWRPMRHPLCERSVLNMLQGQRLLQLLPECEKSWWRWTWWANEAPLVNPWKQRQEQNLPSHVSQ